MWYTYKMEYYIYTIKYVLCTYMNGTGDHHVKWSKQGSEEQSSHVFLQMWKLDLKNKWKRENMFLVMGYLRALWGGRRGIEVNNIKIYCICEDGITKHTESCWIIGERGDRDSVSDRGG
jgi:hypothetical protein